MQQKRNRILIILAAALVIGLLVWRLWPRTLESVSGLDFDQTIELHLWHKETNGTSVTSFSLGNLSPEDESFTSLMALLSDIQCRPSVFNLNPWPSDTVRFKGHDPLIISFIFEGTAQANLHLTEVGEISIDSTAFQGLRVFYAKDTENYEALCQYIKTHGTERTS